MIALLAAPIAALVLDVTMVSPSPAVMRMRAHGAAFVTTLPLGAEIWVDGAYLGRTPAYVDLLDVGKHSIVVSRTGWAAQSATLQVDAGQTALLTLTLSHSGTGPSHGTGTLDVRGSPAGATVFLDGAKIGTVPATASRVSAGYHIVTIVGKPAERTTRDVTVYPDTTTTVSITAGQPEGPAGDILQPAANYVPASAIAINGSAVVIRVRGQDLHCSLGSRSYTLNGKEGLLSAAPAMLGGKLYLPQSLLEHIAGTHRP